MSVNPMPEELSPTPAKGMWKRFLIAAVLIVALAGGATATVALNEVGGIAKEVFPKVNEIKVSAKVVTPVYSGGPQTFLILGSDRRVGSKDAYDREDPPHSDTILLVRFDPNQEQTSVLSIPRDLMVNIKADGGEYYPQEKINAAYTIGNHLGGVKGGMVLSAETIEHEVFPELQLNGIVDVSFQGFIRVVDTLGCAYVNVDHHYYNDNIGTPETDYTSINLQPGYQKLCYEDALNYVRYRHDDSDFVRVARQQDFLRDLRDQINPANELGQIDTVAKAVGRAISTTFHGDASELIELAKLVAFSQGKPLRQVKFQTSNVNFTGPRGGSYVTTTPELAAATFNEFIHGDEKLHLANSATPSHVSHHGHHHTTSISPASIGLYPTGSAGQNEVVSEALHVPFPVIYPALQTGPAVQQQVRAYTLKDQQEHVHHAYVVVWQQNIEGGYYDLEGTDWLNPPIVAHPDEVRHIDGRTYMIVSDGGHIHVIAWREGKVLYWLTNTLLEELTNSQMLAIARSSVSLH
jgi:polyisoprenyl-teichoic acid--peptidoglycan teichoic acid transferase